MPYNNLNASLELPDHGQPRGALLECNRGLRRRRGRQPRNHRLSVRRCLEVPVGRPAEHRRARTRHNGNSRQQRRRRPALEREPRARCDRLWQPDARPGDSATRDYQPAFTDAWYTSGCNPNNVDAAINPLGNDIEASTVSLFVGHNVMHDFAYYLGFDEGHWNASSTTTVSRQTTRRRRPAAPSRRRSPTTG